MVLDPSPPRLWWYSTPARHLSNGTRPQPPTSRAGIRKWVHVKITRHQSHVEWCRIWRCQTNYVPLVWYWGMHCVVLWCSVLQCVVVCCSVLQCVSSGRILGYAAHRMYVSRYTHQCVMSHARQVIYHAWVRDMAHLQMRHVTHEFALCHAHECVMFHASLSRVTLRMRHVSPELESSHTWMRHITTHSHVWYDWFARVTWLTHTHDVYIVCCSSVLQQCVAVHV